MNSTVKSPLPAQHRGSRSLRDQVDEMLPGWQSWYPSLFDAAEDLGILRARVCDLSSLVLSNRHASIYNEAVQAFRNQWSVEEPEAQDGGAGNEPRMRSKTHDDEAGDNSHFPDDVL